MPPLAGVVRRRGREAGPLVASSLAVVLAVALALVGRSPFGGGRTDEVLYPSILLLAAGAVTPLVARGSERARRGALAGVVVVAGVLVGVGATHRAAYPTTDLRPLARQLAEPVNVARSRVVVVDPWLTFTWAYDALSPTAVSFAHTQLSWSQGFHVVSLEPDVVISTNYFFPDRSYSSLSMRTHRVWYVASTVGHQSPIPGHRERPREDRQLPLPALARLDADGGLPHRAAHRGGAAGLPAVGPLTPRPARRVTALAALASTRSRSLDMIAASS